MTVETGVYKGRLIGRLDLDDGLAIFSLEPSEPIHYLPGQYSTLALPINGKAVKRPYSIALSDGTLNFYIRRIDKGGRRLTEKACSQPSYSLFLRILNWIYNR